jgi:small-conductance mechanosensitive channel
LRDVFKHLFANLPDFVWNMILVVLSILVGLLSCWFIHRLLKSRKNPPISFSFRNSLILRLGKPFIFFFPLLLFDLMLPLLRGAPDLLFNLAKLIEILLIISFAALLMGVVELCEDYVVHAYDISKPDNLRERKIRTQLQFVRRLSKITIIIISFCFILLSFDNLRKLGTGLLTGVGVSGVIIGFAAQKSLSGFLAGFQIAFTQPIRIDDVLIVEGEWGRVDEITLTYVVLKLWDKRNLVIPINYFIEKPFQNWTRTNATLVGSVFMYLDFTIPVDKLRTEVTELLHQTPLWDKETNVVQVTNFSEKTVEIRVLVSARNSADAFDLRCFIREGLLNYVTRHYPEALPYARVDLGNNGKGEPPRLG